MGNCILNRVANGIPSGGAINQVLTKNSAADGDAKWVTPSYVPTGGTANQVLTKNSATDGDAKWVTPSYVPTGGAVNQVLTKNSAVDGDAKWVTPSYCLEIFIDEFNSLPQTVSNSLITSDSVVINSILSNPAAQTSDWTVTSTTGALEVSGTISGTTSLTMYLVNKQN